MKRFINSFKYALQGILFCIKSELHFRIHLIASVWVLAVLYTASADVWQYVAVVLCITAVLVAETVNTAIEKLCDRITLDRDDAIKDIKNISAAAALIASVASVLVFILIFSSPDMRQRLLDGAMMSPLCAAVIIILPVAAVLLLCINKKTAAHDTAAKVKKQ